MMKTVFRVLPLLLVALALAGPASGQQAQTGDDEKAGRFDNGKMWTFDHPPAAYFSETYDFDPDQEWFDRARLGALRIPGCTASFVSSYGLVLTNHHCGRNAVTQVSLPGEMLTENGFYAPTLADERRVPGYYADQLVAIEDVTAEVVAAEAAGQTEAERAQARQDTIQAIQTRLLEAAGDGHVVEVIPLYHGGLYSAYTFRRYDDVRLVLTPELQLGFFGGDTDNFTFPRYALDMTFFRVYVDDQPYEPEHYFLWSVDGATVDDPVFVVGNPGSTSRLETVAQLELRRDVTDKNLLEFIDHFIVALQNYQADAPTEEAKNAVRNQLFSLLNAQKAYNGQLAALADPVIMARRRDAEQQFQQAIEADPELDADYGDLIEQMAALQEEFRTLAKPHAAFFALTSGTYSSATLRRAILARTYLDQHTAGVEAEALAQTREQLAGVTDLPDGLDFQFLKTRLEDISAAYGVENEVTTELLDGKSPAARAEDIVAQSMLASQEKAAAALEDDALTASDPAIQMVEAFLPAYRDYQSAFAGLTARQTELASKIGRARFAVYGTEVPPDATFSLRIADGVVQGYPYNGTYASPFTSLFGLYDHFYSYGPESEWALPEKWQNPPEELKMSVPLNFVSTNDIIGGNSGSPVLNRELELVGLIFDGNIESLAGNYIYLPELNRSVSVDARGMLEVMDVMYDADRLVEELINNVLTGAETGAGGGR